MKLADKSKAKYTLIVGDDELAKGRFVLRDMASGDQTEITEAELIEKLKNR